MSLPEKKVNPPWLVDYNRNRAKFPPEELARYAGHQVAYNMEGTRIVASAATEEELEKVLVSKGIAPDRVVVGYVDPLE